MRRFQVFLAVAAVLVLALALVPDASARPGKNGPLVSRLEVEQWSHGPADPVSLRLSLINRSAASVFVPRWHTPADGFEADLFVVERDGEPVDYIGKLVKRGPAAADDYIEVRGGDSISFAFDLSSGYDMSAPGQYTARYRAAVEDALDFDPIDVLGADVKSSPLRRLSLGNVESNTVTFWADAQILASSLAKPAPTDPTYNGCTTTQISTLVTAKSNATTISNKAWSYMKTTPTGSLYTYWFGAVDAQRQAIVTSNFAAIYDAFATKNVTFDCKCKQRYYAYVYPNQPYKIYLCSVFWTAPNLGRDSKAGTLVHEMSHFTVVAGTDDYVYGATGARNLALTDPAKAIDNADNHEYFAEDQP